MRFTHFTQRFQSLHSSCISKEHGEHHRRFALLRTHSEKLKRKHRSNISGIVIRITALSVTYVTRVSFLYSRSMFHVPSVPDVTCEADSTCGTFAPSGTWYARVILNNSNICTLKISIEIMCILHFRIYGKIFN